MKLTLKPIRRRRLIVNKLSLSLENLAWTSHWISKQNSHEIVITKTYFRPCNNSDFVTFANAFQHILYGLDPKVYVIQPYTHRSRETSRVVSNRVKRTIPTIATVSTYAYKQTNAHVLVYARVQWCSLVWFLIAF